MLTYLEMVFRDVIEVLRRSILMMGKALHEMINAPSRRKAGGWLAEGRDVEKGG